MIKYYDMHTHKLTDVLVDKNCLSIHNLTDNEMIEGFDSNIPNLYYSCGLHPWHIHYSKVAVADVERLVTANKKIVAIGECGLDKLIDTPIAIQKQIFEKQIELAAKLELPLVIHCVRAWDELLELHKKHKPQTPWILHGFRGGKEQVEQLIKFGFYFSVGEYFSKEAISVIYLNRLFLETDDSCINIQDVYEKVADALSFRIEFLSEKIDQNVSRVFDL